MSLYINHENQRILWESIQQHPSIDLIPQEHRNDWFKNKVKDVYETIPKPWFHRKITTEELNLLNHSTIRRMLGDLKPPVAILPPDASTTFPASSPNATVLRTSVLGSNQYQQPVNNTEMYGNHMSDQRAVIYPSYNEESMDVGIKSAHTPMIQQRYLEKQQELESMLRQPNPTTTVDFKMSTLDEPITNMEELLKKHAREREQDLALDPRVTTMIPPNSSGDRRSPSELVVQRLLGTEAPLPNSSGSKATFRVSSEEAESPLSNSSGDRRSDASATFQASSQNNIKINITEEPVTISIIDIVSDQISPVIKKTSSLKKHISFQDEVSNATDPLPNSSDSKATYRVSSEEATRNVCPFPEFTYQIPEHVLLEQKIMKLEQEMAVLKKLIFGVYKGMSVCPMQTLLLETIDGENS
jgi:hypothetical protein